MAGRPRLPRNVKIIKGTFQPSRNPEREAEFSALGAIPPPPAKLNKFGKELWKKLIVELDGAGVLTKADLPAFEMMCASYGRYKLYEEWLEKSPLKNVESPRGGVSAQAHQMNAEYEMCKKMMQQFGLTPSDRNRVGLSRKKEADPDTQRMKELIGA